MDLKPHATGDYSVAVVQANSRPKTKVSFTTPSATYVGVYDGHGGPQASRFINNNLFPHLQKLALEEDYLRTLSGEAFDAVRRDFCLGSAWQESGDWRGGDSAAVVAERLSIDHNVGVEEVRKEVEHCIQMILTWWSTTRGLENQGYNSGF
ncbi:hypothetical protein HAX54_018382 [Datura stramonium]|uniref:Protein-serine/threonine phosphatase n=1 Tax=Datura stramonium TaxID=4076 RepID=A0ABS8UPB4_DATST|nr:hypothetical protein [Datura stramonium]